MAKEITIPKCMNPFEVTVNGVSYKFNAGETVEVPDSVASVIENHKELIPKRGKRLFFRYSANADGSNYASVANYKKHRYVGFAFAQKAPADHTEYQWYGFNVPTISGAWVFNETFRNYFGDGNPDLESLPATEIKFTSGGESFVGIDAGCYEVRYYRDNISYGDYIYAHESGMMNGGYAVIDFGKEPQAVSAEFLAWINKYMDAYELPTISGVWVFKDEVAESSDFCPVEQMVNFTNADGQTYYGIGSEGGYPLNYIHYIENGYKSYSYPIEYGCWNNEYDKTVDFGTEPQTVTMEFYNWLTNWANKQ